MKAFRFPVITFTRSVAVVCVLASCAGEVHLNKEVVVSVTEAPRISMPRSKWAGELVTELAQQEAPKAEVATVKPKKAKKRIAKRRVHPNAVSVQKKLDAFEFFASLAEENTHRKQNDLEGYFQAALQEMPSEESDQLALNLVPTLADPETPPMPAYQFAMSSVKPNSNLDLKENVAQIKANFPAPVADFEFKPTVVADEDEKSESDSSEVEETEVAEVKPIDTVVTPVIAKSETPRKSVPVATQPTSEPILVNPKETKKVEPEPKVTAVLAQAGLPVGIIEKKPEPALVKPVVPKTATQTVVARIDVPKMNNRSVNRQASSIQGAEQRSLLGFFDADTALKADLNKYYQKGWHVELHLEPIEIADRQNSNLRNVDGFLYNSYNDSEIRFDIDNTGLDGMYQLWARFYSNGSSEALASVPYREYVHASYKPNIKFVVSRQDYLSHLTQLSQTVSGTSVLNLTLFEAAAGDYRKPPRVHNPKVEIVSHLEKRIFSGDEEGNVRIPDISKTSEFLVHVSADGYLDTEYAVKVGSIDSYQTLHMISKREVEDVSFFTRNAPDPKKSVIMGRIFDPITKKPKEDVSVELSNRKGPPVYFGALPQTWTPVFATLAPALFGFYNAVSNVVRTLVTSTSPASLVVSPKPGYGYFYEFGRSGARKISGKFFDPIHQINPPTTVSFIGKKDGYDTGPDGRFEIENVDLPNGVVVLKAKSKNYPTTLYTIPFDASEREADRAFFMVDDEVVKDSVQKIAKLNLEPGKGSILGGAEPSLFSGHQGCVFVEVTNSYGVAVSAEAGPFAWGTESDPKQPKLCLTPDHPRFSFYNLSPGFYITHLKDNAGKSFREHLTYVDADGISMVIN